jgi:aminopeptidase-like protein
MGNNETSGIVVTARLCQWINKLKNKRYSYRIIFIPETIGSIAYINKNFATLKKNVFAGFVVVCVGVDCMPSFLPSRQGNTISDHAALFSIKKNSKRFKRFSFLERGSDERQFCSEKVNLPICSIMSKKYGDYKEYHTSLDNMHYISAKGLGKSFKIIKDAILKLENTKIISNITPVKKKLKENKKILKKENIYKNIYKYPCEPKLSNYGLRKPISFKTNYKFDKLVLNVLMLSDGENNLDKISKILNQKKSIVVKISKLLVKKKLLKCIY